MFDRVGVCSWSLRPASVADLIEKVGRCGLNSVQLALDPIRVDQNAWPVKKVVSSLADAGITVISAMMGTKGEDYSTLHSIELTGGLRPDETWEDNLAAARENAAIADQLGVALVSFHAGFMPRDKSDSLWTTMRDRVLAVADCFARFDISVALETGQEPPEVLLEFLDDVDNPMIGVNFDPANIILYGNGDPVEAFRTVAPFVDQIHLKDAVPTARPGEWGMEVPLGEGAVDWRSLLEAIREGDFIGDALIEREAGDTRVEDVRRGREFLNAAMSEART